MGFRLLEIKWESSAYRRPYGRSQRLHEPYPAAMPWFSYSDLGANCEERKLLAFSCLVPGFLAQMIAGIRVQVTRSSSRKRWLIV
jgi:hypothetical protein